MKLQFLVRHSLAALAAAGILAASGGRAVAQNDGTVPPPVVLSGLTVSLSTSGYKFTIPADPAAATPSFTATATIYNRSASDIPFSFANPVAVQNASFTSTT